MEKSLTNLESLHIYDILISGVMISKDKSLINLESLYI